MTPFEPPSAVLLVGAAGAGLRAAGEFLRDAGSRVFAADSDVDALKAWAARADIEVVAESGPLPESSTVIHTAAADASHPLIAQAIERRLPTRTYPQWLGELSRQLPVIAVAGTHGKTTTAALLRTALGNVSYLIGGEDRRTGRSGAYRPGAPVVVEACEYRRHFLALSPMAACVLPCEWDHPDAFADDGDVQRAFDEFVGRVRGPIVDLRVFPPPALPSAVPNLGAHLAGNAAAAAETARVLGVGSGDVLDRLSAFAGVRRRFEVLQDGSVTWIDDYAHHPTAVKCTLRQARTAAAGRPLVVLFEPHQASRLTAFEERFAEELRIADEVFVTPVFAAREAAAGTDPVPAFCRRIGPSASPVADLDQLARLLQTRRLAPCVIVVLGAGRIGRFLDERFPQLRGGHRAGTRPFRGDRKVGRGPRALHVAEGRRPGPVRH